MATDQLKLIRETDWDVLIILDACRLDYFKAYNPIRGKLIPAYSPGSCTIEWLNAVFPGYYDFTYVSANPFVNSRRPIREYDARKHFKRIVDVWDWGWSEELSTVPPWNVNKAVLENLDRRMVVHYIQPHGPYIGEIKLTIRGRGVAPGDPMPHNDEIIRRVKRGEISVELLSRAYVGNLKLVLKYVEELVGRLPHRRIVITSDHGELLGEDGQFLHPCGSRNRLLREVPFLIVSST